MKHLYIISLLLFLFQQAYSQDVPDWFLKPDKGEYTGVSLPSDTVSIRESSAIASAILNYCLTDYPERPTTLVESSHNSSGNETIRSVLGLDSVIPFEISRNYTNGQGETFVAIKIKQDAKSYCNLSIMSNSTDTAQSFEETQNMIISGCHDNQMFECLITHNKTNADKDAARETLVLQATTKDAFVDRHFDIRQEKPEYVYENTIDTINYDLFSCDKSLYVAYTQYLIELIHRFFTGPEYNTRLRIQNNYLEVESYDFDFLEMFKKGLEEDMERHKTGLAN